jgi:hypothetical protein
MNWDKLWHGFESIGPVFEPLARSRDNPEWHLRVKKLLI